MSLLAAIIAPTFVLAIGVFVGYLIGWRAGRDNLWRCLQELAGPDEGDHSHD